MSNTFGLIKAFGLEVSKDNIRYLGRNKNGDDVYGILTQKGMIPASIIQKEFKIGWKPFVTNRKYCKCECHTSSSWFVDHYGPYCCVPDNVELEQRQTILNLIHFQEKENK